MRVDSRKKIKEYFSLKDSVFVTLPQKEIETLSVELEEEINKKHPELDHYYRKRKLFVRNTVKKLNSKKKVLILLDVKIAKMRFKIY